MPTAGLQPPLSAQLPLEVTVLRGSLVGLAARAPALRAWASLPLVLADARSPALRAPAPPALARAEPRRPALLASAPDAVVRAAAARPGVPGAPSRGVLCRTWRVQIAPLPRFYRRYWPCAPASSLLLGRTRRLACKQRPRLAFSPPPCLLSSSPASSACPPASVSVRRPPPASSPRVSSRSAHQLEKGQAFLLQALTQRKVFLRSHRNLPQEWTS